LIFYPIFRKIFNIVDFMAAVDFQVLRHPMALLVGIAITLVVWQVGFSEFALAGLCAFIIVSTYYTAVHLPRKNVSMIGGLTQAQYGYFSGFAIMLSGNILLCSTFFWETNWLIYLASVLILLGTGAMVISSYVLFRHIIRSGLKSKS
jgi:hypothetical protein